MKQKKTNSSNLPPIQPEIDEYEKLTPAQKSYWKSLHKQVIEAEKYFWGNYELVRKEGAREPDCPPNYIRSKTPRNLIYDPSQKFTNKRRRGPKAGLGKRKSESGTPRSGDNAGDTT